MNVVEPGEPYAEESPRLAVGIAIVVVALVGIPLGIYNMKIAKEGSQAADVSKYTALSDQVNGTVKSVRDLLEKGVVADVDEGGVKPPTDTWIEQTPPKVDDSTKLIEISGIYWNPRDPLVTIGNDNYRKGDKINGYLIMEIRETSVTLRSPLGDTIVKYLDEAAVKRSL